MGGFFTYKYFTMPDVDDISLETALKDASDLTTQKMVITDAFESTKGKIPLINKNKFLVKYTTTVYAGFNVSEADISKSDRTVTVTIPHCTIDESTVKIKSNDIKLYDANFAVFNISEDALLEVISQAEKRAKKIATSDKYGFLAAADENAIKIIKGLIKKAAGDKEVIVKFK